MITAWSSAENIDSLIQLCLIFKLTIEYFTTVVSAGVLRLGPVRRQQSSVLHDAQQELSDELVKLLQTEHLSRFSRLHSA